jgi:hypothetical protein
VLATAGVTVTMILADRKAAALPAARAAVGSAREARWRPPRVLYCRSSRSIITAPLR